MRARILTVLAVVLVSSPVLADEGMWQPQQMGQLKERVKERGLRLDPSALTDLTKQPLNAVISLGGCTASFVSPEGLVVTNYHCGYGAIQYNSTPERDLTALGFVANSFAEELSAEPSARIWVTESITDVTAKITGHLSRELDGKARFQAIETGEKAVVAECERGGGHRCEVYEFNGGLQYSLIRQLEIRDVRLVYAPTESLGQFGGEVDNFEWPRHTGDWSFLRAYVGKDGSPAAYAKENVPYHPASWLTVARDGLNAGDYVMVAGYPGRTGRYRLADELQSAIEWRYPTMVDYLTDSLATIDGATKGNKTAELKYTSTVASLNNGLKLDQGQLDGFAKMSDPVGVKRGQEAALEAWLAKRGASGQAQSRAIAALESELAAARVTRERDLWFDTATGGGLVGTAIRLYRNSIESARPDADREPGFQDRDAPRAEARLRQLDKRYDPKVDRAVLALRLKRYATLPPAQRVPELDSWLGLGADAAAIGSLEAKLDALYSGTELGNVDARMKWFKASKAEIEASKDSALQLAVRLMPAELRFEEEGKARNGRISALRPQYMQAMIDFNAAEGRPVYPDANGSLRITFGTVVGYSPRDGVEMKPFTSLAGLAAKSTDKAPFDSPKAEMDAIAAKAGPQYRLASLQDVPVNFLSDVDTTGGNSGSPTLNAKGELVGLLFDGNYESLASDWMFDRNLNRSIHVDFRYTRWVMDEVDHAERLLKEMGLPVD